MKIITTVAFTVCLSLNSICQSRIQNDTLFFKNVKIVKGDFILLGQGSNSTTRGFNFILPNSVLAGAEGLHNSWAGRKVEVRKFKRLGNDKYYVILLINGLNYHCDIENAVNANEVILPGMNNINHVPSTADEISKLKKLLDSGAITKEEYEKQKQKLLN